MSSPSQELDENDFTEVVREDSREQGKPVEDKDEGEDDEEVEDTIEFGEDAPNEAEKNIPNMSTSALRELDGQWRDGQQVCTACVSARTRYVCVDFPCLIKNKKKALSMLGGIDGVEKTLSRGGRFELNFRPTDPFCKPTVSSERKCWNLLIKVRRRKSKPPVARSAFEGEGGGSDPHQFQVQVLGVVDTLISFENQCDFQFLPVTKDAAGRNEEILSSIVPAVDVSREDYLERNCPLFLPPTMFSRRERPCFYALENDPTTIPVNTQANSLRAKREHGSHIINFDQQVQPETPHPVAERNVARFLPNYLATETFKSLKKLFDQRPVWSKTACLAQLRDDSLELHLKYLLPMLAYCFLTGPWRNLWCRFGYDPRQERGAKCYQVVDYRVRSAFNRNKVSRKRQKETCRAYPQSVSRSYDASLELEPQQPTQQQAQGNFDPKYMYRADTLPPYRQMRYQLCDIVEPQIQHRVHLNDGQETECTERDGWCVKDISDFCRDVLNTHVERLLESKPGLET